MIFPTNITREHLIKAIERILRDGIPSLGDSRFYDVIYEEKKYPPKLIVSYANQFANGIELDRNSFNGGKDTPCFKLLEKEGFQIIEKTKFPKIKLYDLHGASALSNYETLLSPDKADFYWDNKQFKKYNNGDIVFWINRVSKKALYTIIDNISIIPEYRDGRTYIKNDNYEVSASAQSKEQFETFIKLKVVEIRNIDLDW